MNFEQLSKVTVSVIADMTFIGVLKDHTFYILEWKWVQTILTYKGATNTWMRRGSNQESERYLNENTSPKKHGKQEFCKSRLLSSTKGEANRIEL